MSIKTTDRTQSTVRERLDFSRIPAVIEIPNLIGIQKKSFEYFLQTDTAPAERKIQGLEEVFQDVFPISDLNINARIDYVGYEVGVWECACGEYKELGGVGVVCETCGQETNYKEKFKLAECRQKGLTYSDPIKIMVRMVLFQREKIEVNARILKELPGKYIVEEVKNPETGKLLIPARTEIDDAIIEALQKFKVPEVTINSVKEVKEQKIFLGEMPVMGPTGTFMINGVERVIVSQMHRSPGAFFAHDKGRSHVSGKILYSARVIPDRGSWLDFEFDIKDILHVKIDRRRKLPATVLLSAFGMNQEEILAAFYTVEKVSRLVKDDRYFMGSKGLMCGIKVLEDVIDPKTEDVLVKSGKKIAPQQIKKLRRMSKAQRVEIDKETLIGGYLAQDIVDKETGEVLLDSNTEITPETLAVLSKHNVSEFSVLSIDEEHPDTAIRDTLAQAKIADSDEAIREIYKRLRPGDPPTTEIAKTLFYNLFFNPKRYNLSVVGRIKMNQKFGLDVPLENRLLTRDDLIAVIRYMVDLRNGIGVVDDIDHLGNRRVRAVGESLENQFRVGLVRMERAIIERMSIQDLDVSMPHDLINSKPVTAAIKEFYGSSQLSQFMDQTNPLSEVTHKRRLSALGPGGLTRERAGFEVRDVHPTHYGRICPIETPEGPNIGLIASLSTYARVNDYGFVETPYRRVTDAKVSDNVEFHNAMVEDDFVIAQANAELDDKNRFVNEIVDARQGGDFILSPREKINLMDVSPKQLISVAASLIPFLENDDANRALMGSNMQRQAVPLLQTEAPLVGTGMEEVVARDSGAVVVAENDGEVISSDASRIVVRTSGRQKKKGMLDSSVDIYTLAKYQRSNQNTCINQRPLVRTGEKVKKGQVIADGPSTDLGELALGRNVLVAFMPWEGYNFEDAIVISEKVVKEDVFTSVHIEEFEVEARDTKQGKEDITRDISNVGEEALRNLDDSGIIRIGASVAPNDILVGKITPKGETQLSPEEKLLKAIFGEKAGDVRDTSLRVPPGIQGIVIDVKVFSRKGVDKDSRTLSIEEEEVSKIEKDFSDEIEIVKNESEKKLLSMLVGKQVTKATTIGKKVFKKGQDLTEEDLAKMPSKDLAKIPVKDVDPNELQQIEDASKDQIHILKTMMNDKIAKLKKGDDLAPGVIKLVKVFVAMKRKLQVGDKMAGRHGNKGVVSKIVPEEDMPYMDDGTPIELILNPLGVPSRMNVGQIFETNLGMAAKASGKHVATPVFDGAQEEDVRKLLVDSGCSPTGEVRLFDGRTGQPFHQKVMVGYIYMLKLHHLVDDKIHARSTGPYSLVTQQPLGGKAQFGGQRLGEMEVWALEAYGGAYTLQEMLTVKSDDVEGRKRMYEAIVKGDTNLTPSLPESFNVLVKELQSLAIDVELMETASK
ncbi:DNA-directed RNA polymerase subunit beta [Nitrospina gracilis]|uniref:DNA-directed RNA polymerase subunit beta n=1 Tax=Nitrospina gracilis TaxID=35801 RepID=UPI001F0091A3|nr:DNA-directed RNA polymerase subunit beta [Nitrospina gracilis]MCF8721748.1 DNA-directed RNA polymerase subunit beta [Nitrospina gracilis Nb-211]